MINKNTMEGQQNSPNTTVNDEIDLIELLKQLWIRKKIIFYSIIAGGCMGLLIAILTPNMFSSSTSIVPQISGETKVGGNLSGLAALAGIDFGSVGASEELSPYLYPLLVESVPFQLELMHSEFNYEDSEEPVSYFKYQTEIKTLSILQVFKKYTIGLPFLIIEAIKGEEKMMGFDLSESKNIYKFTKDEAEVSEILTENISIDINDKENFIVIKSTSPEPLLSAQLTEKVTELLQKYITKIKIAKAQENLVFLKERMKEKEINFKKVQQKLAKFSDRNKNVVSVISSMKQQNLQSEYSLAFGVYSELAKQIEQAEIQVKKDTPILTTVQPVQIPDEKSSPKRLLVLLIWTFLGGVLSCGWILVESPLKDIWTKINS